MERQVTMEVRNKKIRDYAKEKKVPLWKIAERYRGGITDSYFSKLLRKKFTDEEEKEILSIINNISKEV